MRHFAKTSKQQKLVVVGAQELPLYMLHQHRCCLNSVKDELNRQHAGVEWSAVYESKDRAFKHYLGPVMSSLERHIVMTVVSA